MNPNAPRTLGFDYFSKIYGANADPWQFETSPYEKEKYLSSLSALPRQHYEQGFEVGGSISVLTRMLADRCHQLLSVDLSPVAQRRARTRCADQPHVKFMIMQFPSERPTQGSSRLFSRVNACTVQSSSPCEKGDVSHRRTRSTSVTALIFCHFRAGQQRITPETCFVSGCSRRSETRMRNASMARSKDIFGQDSSHSPSIVWRRSICSTSLPHGWCRHIS